MLYKKKKKQILQPQPGSQTTSKEARRYCSTIGLLKTGHQTAKRWYLATATKLQSSFGNGCSVLIAY
jgi:hypothetical protein